MTSDELTERFMERRPSLEHIARAMEAEIWTALDGIEGIDRVSFRAKKLDSFLTKASKRNEDGTLKYTHPLEEIEDQVAGRVQVLFRSTILAVRARLEEHFHAVEAVTKEKDEFSFGYESLHLVMQIPPQVFAPGWASREDRIVTMELQVRTLFMHAWAELEHDLGYKLHESVQLTKEERKSLSWAAASAWGADQEFERVRDGIASRVEAVRAAPKAVS